jgi:hypothetical protein
MGSASCFLQTPVSGFALALLALSFRPVTADVLVSLLAFHQKQQCTMPGAHLVGGEKVSPPPNRTGHTGQVDRSSISN